MCATLGSATIGAGVVWIFDKAAPSATTATVFVEDGLTERFDDVTVPIDNTDVTMKGLVDSEWVTPIRRPAMPLSELREILEENRGHVERHTQSVERLKRDLPLLRTILSHKEKNKTNAENFIDIWEPNDGLIYGAVRGNFARGSFPLPEPMPVYSGEPFLHEDIAARTGEGAPIYGVSKRGSKFVSALVPTNKEELPLNFYAAKALQYFDIEGLSNMLDLSEREIGQQHLHERLLEGIDRHLLSLSRWAAIVFVTNTGSRPMSVSPNVKLIVDTEKTTVNKPFITIEMEHRNEFGMRVPVNVPGGESRAILFASKDLISARPDWNVIHSMYENSSRKCFFILSYSPNSLFGESTLFSSVVTFGHNAQSDDTTEDDIRERFQ